MSNTTHSVRVLQSDIQSQTQKALLINIVKYAFHQTFGMKDYQDMINNKHCENSEIVKQNKFRKQMVFHIYNQLINGNLEHYVLLIGQEYMLQVKYRKGSMIKFDILGYTLLLYEVPYIAVPNIKAEHMLKDHEYSMIGGKNEDSIKIEVKQVYLEDENLDKIQHHIIQALKETLVWFQHSDKNDERNDNLSGVMLSRFAHKSESHNWHIIFGDIVPESSKHGKVITGHEVRIKCMNEMTKPLKRIRLDFFMKLNAVFPFRNKSNGKETMKKVEVVVFNQQHNPQTSVESMFSGFRNLTLSSFLSINAMAIYAFLCMLSIFYLNKVFCYEKELGGESGLLRDEGIIMEENENEGIVQKICKAKNHFLINLGVGLLVLTVIRQFLIKKQTKKDRIR